MNTINDIWKKVGGGIIILSTIVIFALIVNVFAQSSSSLPEPFKQTMTIAIATLMIFLIIMIIVAFKLLS